MNEYLFNKPLYVRSVINLRLNLGKIMRILSILFLTIIFSNSVYAQSTVWSPDFRVSNVKFIDLNLLDDAKNGCWTNLKEVREYADEKLRMKGARFHEHVIWKYFLQVADALKHMHSRRIMHRDLKPANIFLTVEAEVKVGDLGLGRHFSDETMEAFSKVGTPLYMSPEVLKGKGYNFIYSTINI